MLHMHCNIPCMFDHWAGPVVHLLPLKSSMVESIDKHTLVIISFSYKICLPLSLSQMLSIFSIDSFSHSQYTQVIILHPFSLCVLQRDGICIERVSQSTFYPFQNKHQNLRHLQSIRMLCTLKNLNIVKVMKWVRLT